MKRKRKVKSTERVRGYRSRKNLATILLDYARSLSRFYPVWNALRSSPGRRSKQYYEQERELRRLFRIITECSISDIRMYFSHLPKVKIGHQTTLPMNACLHCGSAGKPYDLYYDEHMRLFYGYCRDCKTKYYYKDVSRQGDVYGNRHR